MADAPPTGASRDQGQETAVSNWRINPEWVRYNNLHNEGGEGYNPHRKSLDTPAPSAVSASAAKVEHAKVEHVKDERGNIVDRSKMQARLAADLIRIERVTDPFGRKIVQAAIDYARKALEIAQ
jgi:hypothetical protein